MCCNGKIQSQPSGFPMCCGTEAYNYEKYMCRGGRVEKRPPGSEIDWWWPDGFIVKRCLLKSVVNWSTTFIIQGLLNKVWKKANKKVAKWCCKHLSSLACPQAPWSRSFGGLAAPHRQTPTVHVFHNLRKIQGFCSSSGWDVNLRQNFLHLLLNILHSVLFLRRRASRSLNQSTESIDRSTSQSVSRSFHQSISE